MKILNVLLLLAALPAVADTAPPPATPLPIALVQALNQVAGGPHPGYRANHAKGIMVSGRFVPAPEAAAFSRAAHFSRSVPVLVRFSDATGVPTMPDADPNASPHGMAIRFELPGGRSTDIVSISANGFPVATPEDFLALLTAAAASGPGAAEPTPIAKFLGSHPAAREFVTTPRPPPVSFATLAFYGVDAFKFTNRRGEVHYGRYQILPVAGAQALSDAAAASAAPDYLIDELPKRIAAAPIAFELVAQVAAEGDVTDDPTVVWSADHRVVKLGTITLDAVLADQKQAQKLIMFDPLSLLDGIAPSADPVLLARPSAYGVSYAQRIR